MNIHAFAKAIPEMTEDEYKQLKSDIKEHGQKVPIIIYKGEVLDGRHRSRICQELKLTPKVVEFKGTEVEAASLVVSLNIKRRHLTVGQRSRIVNLTLRPAVEAAAKEKQIESKKGNANAAKNKKGNTALDDLEEVNTTKALAKAAGVSEGAIKQDLKVMRYSTPEVSEAVASGKISLGAAAKTVKDKGNEKKILTRDEFWDSLPKEEKKEIKRPWIEAFTMTELRDFKTRGFRKAFLSAKESDQKAYQLEVNKNFEVAVSNLLESTKKPNPGTPIPTGLKKDILDDLNELVKYVKANLKK